MALRLHVCTRLTSDQMTRVDIEDNILDACSYVRKKPGPIRSLGKHCLNRDDLETNKD